MPETIRRLDEEEQEIIRNRIVRRMALEPLYDYNL